MSELTPAQVAAAQARGAKVALPQKEAVQKILEQQGEILALLKKLTEQGEQEL